MNRVALLYEQLVAEIQAECIEVEAMKWANEWRKQQNQSLAYGEEAFQEKADKIRELGQQILALSI